MRSRAYSHSDESRWASQSSRSAVQSFPAALADLTRAMTKSAGMRRSAKWMIVALISFGLRLAMPYLEGRTNSRWAVPPMLPADLLPLLSLFVSSFILFLIWIREIVAKRPALTNACLFFVSLLLFGFSFTVRTTDFFHRGFFQYANRVLTADEWRRISQFAQEHLQSEGRLPGPRKNLWDENEHRKLWSALCAATKVEKLNPSLMILVHPGSTEIVWGGALSGHWGVTISTSKSSENSRASSKRWRIAEDIATSVGPY